MEPETAEDEMEYIRSKYISETIENTRKLNVEKWSKGYTSALPKDDLEDYKPPKNKLEASGILKAAPIILTKTVESNKITALSAAFCLVILCVFIQVP